MCACITFAFVIVGTFISRSGLVQSVHAFEGDPVSLVLFGALIVVALLAGVVGLVVRWKSFGPAADGSDEVENLLSKEGAYYFNNVIMVVFATLLAYLTVSSALPGFLPFGGQTVSSARSMPSPARWAWYTWPSLRCARCWPGARRCARSS